jgi:hypothetical protein
MMIPIYVGGTILATSVASSLATKAITGAPTTIASLFNRAGISDYFYSTAKSSYRNYYKMMVNEGTLFDNVMNILSKNADKAYGVRQDPRNLNKIFGADESWISSDILCFRNSTNFYDYSAFGRARVRFYYHEGCAVIMCQKKHELDDFCKRLSIPNFDQKSLTFVGIG